MRAVTDAADAVDRGALIAEGRTAQVYALGDDRVVKVLRTGFPDEQGNAEALAARLADGAAIGAPAFFGTTRVDGRFGLIYERVEGESMLEHLTARTGSSGSLATTLGTLHAAMHQASGHALPPFRAAIEAALGGSARHAGKGAVGVALRRLHRLPEGTAICHGDFHPGNVMMTASGPRVIDWLTASSGPPAADVARTLFLLRDGQLPREIPVLRRLRIALLRRRFVAGYLDAYRRHRPLDLDEVRAWRLPTLVARLDEDIEPERDHLRRLIDAELSRAHERRAR
jgi:aminoglycoside phosphotransferase (APT) family kinase protein